MSAPPLPPSPSAPPVPPPTPSGPSAPRREIALITRVRTLNKGNQALSAAWLEAVRRAFPDAVVRVLERRPPHLVQHTLRALAGARDPLAAFDALTTRLAALAPGPGAAGAPGPARILLDETIPPPVRFPALRQRLNLRGRAAALGLYAGAYRARLAALQRADLVVINPAGEFYPREPQAAYYYLLEADVARKLGRPTAMVNHTMDITDPTLRRLIPRVYRDLAMIGFRDDKSAAAFRAMGGDERNVVVTPDLALTTVVPRPAPRRPGTIAIAINVPEAKGAGYLDQWREVVDGALARGWRVELVSNEYPAELGHYERLRAAEPRLVLAGAGLDHDRYGELLGGYDLVISSRLHTAVLAMCAGAPVVAVEGASFKITGVFAELGLARPVVRPGAPGWAAAALAQADAVLAARDAESADALARVAAVRARIDDGLLPRLRAAAPPTP